METTIKRKIKPSVLVNIFENYAEFCNIRYYNTNENSETIDSDKRILFEIKIRHNSDEKPNILLKNAIKEFKKDNQLNKDFKDLVTTNYLNDLAESHIDVWKDRYKKYKNKSDVSFDLNVNHNPSLKIERLEKELNRKLNNKEESYLINMFNKTVVKNIDLRQLRYN